MHIRTNMRLLRDNRGLSLRQLKDLTGIGYAELNRMERGLQAPTDKELEEICIALGVTVDMLYPDPRLREVLAE